MEIYFEDTVGRGLRHYVRLVSEALGLRGDCSYVQTDELACAYIALDGRLRQYPDEDVALLWDEGRGWSAAVETHSGKDPLVVAHLDRDVLPAPSDVAAWTRNLFRPHATVAEDGRGEPRAAAEADHVRDRLLGYARPRPATASTGG
jgi:hypothetical protein